MMILCGIYREIDVSFLKLTSSPRRTFEPTGRVALDSATLDYQLLVHNWVEGLVHEYFPLSILRNLEEVEIEWFNEVLGED